MNIEVVIFGMIIFALNVYITSELGKRVRKLEKKLRKKK